MIKIHLGLFAVIAGIGLMALIGQTFLAWVASMAVIGIGYFLIIHSLSEADPDYPQNRKKKRSA